MSETNNILRLSQKIFKVSDYSHGCIMVPIPDEFKRHILKELAPQIPQDILVDDKDETTNGIETEGHVSLLWGIETKPEHLKIIKEHFTKPIIAKSLAKVEYFDNDETAAYIPVESSDMDTLHDILKKELPNVDDHDEFIPHITIAYILKGERLNLKDIKPFEWQVTKLSISKPDGTIEDVYAEGFEPEHKEVEVISRLEQKVSSLKVAADQTFSPEFISWFGDSKVVDQEGNPLVVYHGTPQSGFFAFDPEFFNEHTKGEFGSRAFHFTGNPEVASNYSEGYELENAELYKSKVGEYPKNMKNINPGVYPVYLRMENPLNIGVSKNITLAIIDVAKARGYDGLISDIGNGSMEFVVFDPTQIKSAIGNKGSFDPSNPDITARLKSKVENLKVAAITIDFDSSGSWIAPDGEDLSVPENIEHHEDAVKNLGFKGTLDALRNGYVRVMETSSRYVLQMDSSVSKTALYKAMGYMRGAIGNGMIVGVDFGGNYAEATNKMELGQLIRDLGLSKVAAITLEISKGDTILTGKWRNHKEVVKTIGHDEYGPTVNGKSILKIRIPKKSSIMATLKPYLRLRQKVANLKVVEDSEGNELSDLDGTPIAVNTDGTIVLYHRTSKENADKILATGDFFSLENTDETFFSTKPDGQILGYGDTVITVKVKPSDVRLDDVFHGEIHVAVPNDKLSKKNIKANLKVLSTAPLVIVNEDAFAYQKEASNVHDSRDPIYLSREQALQLIPGDILTVGDIEGRQNRYVVLEKPKDKSGKGTFSKPLFVTVRLEDRPDSAATSLQVGVYKMRKVSDKEKPEVFLGGECKTDWRDDIIKEFKDSMDLIDPVDPDWKAETNIYQELTDMAISDEVIFFKGGQGSRREKKFLDAIGKDYEEFKSKKDLKKHLEKISVIETSNMSKEEKANVLNSQTFYHGTRSDIDVPTMSHVGKGLDVGGVGLWGNGIYITNDKEWANSLAHNIQSDGTPKVLALKTKVQNPLIIDLSHPEKWNEDEEYLAANGWPNSDRTELAPWALSKGYDAIALNSDSVGMDEVVILKDGLIYSEQMEKKVSAVGNPININSEWKSDTNGWIVVVIDKQPFGRITLQTLEGFRFLETTQKRLMENYTKVSDTTTLKNNMHPELDSTAKVSNLKVAELESAWILNDGTLKRLSYNGNVSAHTKFILDTFPDESAKNIDPRSKQLEPSDAAEIGKNKGLIRVTLDNTNWTFELNNSVSDAAYHKMVSMMQNMDDKTVWVDFDGKSYAAVNKMELGKLLNVLNKRMGKMASNEKSDLQTGIEIEKEHKPTYDRLKEYYEENQKWPSEDEFFKWIAQNHLDEYDNYYKELPKFEENLKKAQGNMKTSALNDYTSSYKIGLSAYGAKIKLASNPFKGIEHKQAGWKAGWLDAKHGASDPDLNFAREHAEKRWPGSDVVLSDEEGAYDVKENGKVTHYMIKTKDGLWHDRKALNPLGSKVASRPENQKMQEFLASNEIDARVKYIFDGSLKKTWRLYNPDVKWSTELADRLNTLGFTDYNGKPLGQFSGNGGVFSVFVRGHDEFLENTKVAALSDDTPLTIYDYNDTTEGWDLMHSVSLNEFFAANIDMDPMEQARILQELESKGEVITGGGAAPAFLIKKESVDRKPEKTITPLERKMVYDSKVASDLTDLTTHTVEKQLENAESFLLKKPDSEVWKARVGQLKAQLHNLKENLKVASWPTEDLDKEKKPSEERRKEIVDFMKQKGFASKTKVAETQRPISTDYLTEAISDNNAQYGTEFSIGGSYGNYDLWAKTKDGDERIESGSRKDIYNAFVKYRFNEKYRVNTPTEQKEYMKPASESFPTAGIDRLQQKIESLKVAALMDYTTPKDIRDVSYLQSEISDFKPRHPGAEPKPSKVDLPSGTDAKPVSDTLPSSVKPEVPGEADIPLNSVGEPEVVTKNPHERKELQDEAIEQKIEERQAPTGRESKPSQPPHEPKTIREPEKSRRVKEPSRRPTSQNPTPQGTPEGTPDEHPKGDGKEHTEPQKGEPKDSPKDSPKVAPNDTKKGPDHLFTEDEARDRAKKEKEPSKEPKKDISKMKERLKCMRERKGEDENGKTNKLNQKVAALFSLYDSSRGDSSTFSAEELKDFLNLEEEQYEELLNVEEGEAFEYGRPYTITRLPESHGEGLPTGQSQPLPNTSGTSHGSLARKVVTPKPVKTLKESWDPYSVLQDVNLTGSLTKAFNVKVAEGEAFSRHADITFETITEESAEAGDAEERGYESEGLEIVDSYDIGDVLEVELNAATPEQLTDAVAKATVKYLNKNGFAEPSSSHYQNNLWYSSTGEPSTTEDFETGNQTIRSFHFGTDYTDEEKRKVAELMGVRPNLTFKRNPPPLGGGRKIDRI